MSEVPNPGARVFRRKRRFQGASWTPSNMSAIKEDGIWCPVHRQRHGYKSSKLGFAPELRRSGWVIMWYCKETGNVLKEQELNNE